MRTTLPMLTIDVGRLELTFVNLVSNAIEYSDPDKPERHVEVCEAKTQTRLDDAELAPGE